MEKRVIEFTSKVCWRFMGSWSMECDIEDIDQDKTCWIEKTTDCIPWWWLCCWLWCKIGLRWWWWLRWQMIWCEPGLQPGNMSAGRAFLTRLFLDILPSSSNHGYDINGNGNDEDNDNDDGKRCLVKHLFSTFLHFLFLPSLQPAAPPFHKFYSFQQ